MMMGRKPKTALPSPGKMVPICKIDFITNDTMAKNKSPFACDEVYTRLTGNVLPALKKKIKQPMISTTPTMAIVFTTILFAW